MRLDITLVAARFLGPLFVVAGILAITQPSRVLDAIGGFLTDPSLMILAGFVTLLLGLALVTFHQRWDTITASVITLIGWLFLARGAIMLLAPDLILAAANFVESQRRVLPIAGCVAALAGVWFTYTGYISGTLRADR